MEHFLSGAVAMGFAVAGLLFLSYWRRLRERLFMMFAISFFMLSVNYTWLAVTEIPAEERSLLFLVRLVAFGLIIIAIIQSNRPTSR
jgi:uncharacterized membrane protein